MYILKDKMATQQQVAISTVKSTLKYHGGREALGVIEMRDI